MNHVLDPVLFLDIDDVLCMSDPYGGYDALDIVHGRRANAEAVFRDLFDARATRVLADLHDRMGGRLRYVISSTWRQFFDRHQFAEIFRRTGLSQVAERLDEGVRWCTPSKLGRSLRVDEIAQWLDLHHRGEPFAIVDDTYSGPSLLPALQMPGHPFVNRVVLCQAEQGLLDEHAQHLVDALRRPATLGGA